ncbi:1-aminocyclopropane-1-carboxylate deaminase [Sphingobacterium allocomposti]|uniref:1-aminocyclopropane-1-carboxylate deaminase n=1 Tax=Sphingobacterium allocomposti TaxID=415956 RepID=A0A5S5D9X7_9SPHI|nr:pyridoxal-phosphate dependent enzyme [Sphingobacterium composti Yoo et al. 2007 non Ten et al. 2007]TYP92485.1 1-aminocyclopropane-1-carboxylate deaminase [Sphingobacterium composti Yoo et al. 2007 non Ten et al. 2007]HLS95897.1 pyridoxal-phosphate dependent enzyme [Sphingobacterium sp.]
MLNFDFYSPEEEIRLPLYEKYNVRVFLKRDDLIHPYISGNKWRKLKYTLEEASSLKKEVLVTYGGPWSNHLLATACAGARFGFRTHAFVRGEPVANPVLSMCKLFGMTVTFVDRKSYVDKRGLYDHHFGQDDTAYLVQEGGYGTAGAKGCAEIVHELVNVYDHCFCAAGTGTTLAGLCMGMNQLGIPTSLHGVPVLKGGQFILEEVASLGVDTARIKLHLDYHFGGYAKTKPELLAFVRSYVQQTGVMIEPTYTGKLFYAIHDLMEKGQLAPGAKVLIIHTGGLTGLLGMLDRF